MSIMGIGKVLAETIASSRSLDKAYSILEIIYKKDIKLLKNYLTHVAITLCSFS